jgi:hypothetical protein
MNKCGQINALNTNRFGRPRYLQWANRNFVIPDDAFPKFQKIYHKLRNTRRNQKENETYNIPIYICTVPFVQYYIYGIVSSNSQYMLSFALHFKCYLSMRFGWKVSTLNPWGVAIYLLIVTEQHAHPV